MSDRLSRRVEVGGERLDVFLSSIDGVPSRAFAKRLIAEGQVMVNGNPPTKAGQRLQAGDVIDLSLPPPAPSTVEPEAIPLDIVYEDEHLLVVNKPAGMVVHPAPGHATGTLVNALLHRYPELPGIGGVMRPGIVHRLDKETSGLLVVAKTGATLTALIKEMKARRITRRYLGSCTESSRWTKGRSTLRWAGTRSSGSRWRSSSEAARPSRTFASSSAFGAPRSSRPSLKLGGPTKFESTWHLSATPSWATTVTG